LILMMSVVVLMTSLVDLFVNRLLFRAGPEVLAHLNFDATGLAVIGAINLNLEQLALFILVGFSAYMLIRNGRRLERLVGLILVIPVVCSALLYAPLPDAVAWAVSVMIILSSALVAVCLATSRAILGARERRLSGSVTVVFMATLALSFLLPFYYRLSLLVGAAGIGVLPLSLESYDVGIIAVWGATLAAFAYSVLVPSNGYRTSIRTVAKAMIIPTLVVGPLLYGLVSSFFMTQIFSLVIAMSTDFALSVYSVQVMAVVWWFLLTAVMLLVMKGRGSSDRSLVLKGIGLLLLMSTTFLFNYPYYIMLGLMGVILITHPVSHVRQ
jgi:hypothetical protein